MMKKAFLTLPTVFALSLMVAACGQQNNKKETFVRGKATGNTQKTRQKPNQTDSNRDQSTQPAADNKNTTEQALEQAVKNFCRLTDSNELTAEMKAQDFCDAITVTLQEDASITLPKGLHSLKKASTTAFEFKGENEIEVDTQDSKRITLQHEFTKENSKTESDYRLFVSFQLAHSLTEVDSKKENIDLLVNNKDVAAEKFEVIEDQQNNKVNIRVTDLSLFDKLPFSIKITYSLKK